MKEANTIFCIPARPNHKSIYKYTIQKVDATPLSLANVSVCFVYEKSSYVFVCQSKYVAKNTNRHKPHKKFNRTQ